MDTTDLPLHGKQEGRFFHGYYDNYCYLPLYVFCGEHVLCARLREANHDAAFGSLAEIRRIVAQIRAAWPEVKIILRGDSGFCRNELMSWCENNGVDFVFGLARNQRLRRIIGQQMQEATQQWNQTGKPARVFTEFALPDEEDEEGRLGPRAARGGQGRAHRRQRESALCGDLAEQRAMGGAGVVRRTLLRARRHGEPHQGAVQLVRRPGERGNDAGQSDAAVSVGDGLYSGERVAAAGAESDGTGAGAGIDDPHEAAEDRRADPGDGAQSLGFDGFQLSLAGPLSAGLGEPALLKPTLPAQVKLEVATACQRPCGALSEIAGACEKGHPTCLGSGSHLFASFHANSFLPRQPAPDSDQKTLRAVDHTCQECDPALTTSRVRNPG